MQVPNKDMADHILKLTVIDAGRTKRRAIIGHVTFPLRELEPDSEQKLFKMDLEKVSTRAWLIEHSYDISRTLVQWTLVFTFQIPQECGALEKVVSAETAP